MAFEWGAAKNTANLAKLASTSGTPFGYSRGRSWKRPTADETGEERVAALGVAMGLELYVVYTIRGGKRRIISTRRANKHEREAYRLACAQ